MEMISTDLLNTPRGFGARTVELADANGGTASNASPQESAGKELDYANEVTPGVRFVGLKTQRARQVGECTTRFSSTM
jgi:hypothetical protein